MEAPKAGGRIWRFRLWFRCGLTWNPQPQEKSSLSLKARACCQVNDTATKRTGERPVFSGRIGENAVDGGLLPARSRPVIQATWSVSMNMVQL